MAARARILIVDDEISIVEVLKGLFKREGYAVKTSGNGEEALTVLRKYRCDLMLSDVRMKPMDGIELLSKARDIQPHLAVIMMTAYAAVETAVEAMKEGAFDYICKPFKVDELLMTVERALSYEHVLEENESLKETLKTKFHFTNLVGDHPRMQQIYRMIEKVGGTDSTVLILGESGTGKELVAKAVHFSSKRSGKPFVAVNCAAMTETLLESELFGYVKGAFTGADKFKKGLFETANGGTLFLDEVGAIPLAMQTTLLRVLQEHEIRPVGGTENIPVDVRIVAATNEDLGMRIRNGQFREDLYYRLSVIPVELPALRERPSDIPLLVNFFLEEIAGREGKKTGISEAALSAFQAHLWPGNVRELENAVNRAATLCDGDMITVNVLPGPIREHAPTETVESRPPNSARTVSLKAHMREQERAYIAQILGQCDGDKEAAAKSLGVSLATLYRKYSDS